MEIKGSTQMKLYTQDNELDKKGCFDDIIAYLDEIDVIDLPSEYIIKDNMGWKINFYYNYNKIFRDFEKLTNYEFKIEKIDNDDYKMTKEEFIKQRMEIDKVTRKDFDKNYIVIECDCGKSYCNGWRCLTKSDINDENLFNYIKKIENEKKQFISWLKKQIQNTTPNLKVNYYRKDGFLEAQQINSSRIDMQPVNITFKQILDYVEKIDENE